MSVESVLAAREAIQNRQEFTAGAMRGVRDLIGGERLLAGAARQEYLATWALHLDPDEFDFKVTYTVLSYDTPIAWFVETGDEYRGWTVIEQKFSVTTTRHQGLVKQALREAGEWERTRRIGAYLTLGPDRLRLTTGGRE